MNTKFILLITGAVLSLLFLVFAAQVFEVLYYEREFSNEMFNQGHYTTVGLLVAGVAWGLSAVYYYAVNSVSFSRWYHWLIVLAVAAVAVTIATYVWLDGQFADDGLDFSGQLLNFAVITMLVEAVAFTVASFSMRWWSSNCRHTPFPE